MKLNPELIDIMQQNHMDVDLCCLFLLMYHHGLDHVAAARKVLTPEEEAGIRINLMKLNLINGDLELLLPLYEVDNPNTDHSDKFDYYRKSVAKVLSPDKKAKIRNTPETQLEFSYLLNRIPDLNLERLIEVTIHYYNNVEFSTNLSKFLAESADLYYESGLSSDLV
jgi:hypothetical protein